MKINYFTIIVVISLVLTLVPTINAVPHGPTINSTVVLYWKLNNNSGIGENATKAVDSSQYSRNGTIAANPAFNSTWGILGDGAYILNGINQSITAVGTNNTMMNSSLGFTACAFQSFQSLKNNNNMFGKTTDSPGAASLTDWGVAGSTTAITGKVGNGTTQTSITIQGTLSVDNRTWYCLDYNVTHVRGFVNGARTVSTAKNFAGDVQELRDFQVGFSSNAARWGNITVDEVVVWNVSHTDAELAQIWLDYNGGCVNITENYLAGANTVFCPGTYSFNDTDLNGVIQATASGITIDGGGAILQGNLTNNSIGINVTLLTDVTIKNFVFKRYSDAVDLQNADRALVNNSNFSNNSRHVHIYTTADDVLLQNLLLNDTDNVGIKISNSDRSILTNLTFNNALIPRFGSNSTDVEKGFIYLDSGVDRMILQNSTLTDATTNYFRIAGTSHLIRYNTMAGQTLPIQPDNGTELFETYRQIWGDSGGNGTNITHNNFSKSQYPIFLDDGSAYILIKYNHMHDVDIASRVGGESHVFDSNLLTNVTAHYDGYDLGVKIIRSRNITFTNNTCTEVVTCVWVTASNNTNISNNNMSGIPFASRSLYNASDSYDIAGAILVSTTFKSWLTEGFRTYNGTVITQYNHTVLEGWRSSNVTISNNTMSNYNVLLYTEGANNVTQDVNTKYNPWIRHTYFPTIVYFEQYFYIDNAFGDIKVCTGPNGFPCTLSNILEQAYRSKSVMNYTMSKNYSYFQNANSSFEYGLTQNAVVYNQTRTLAYFSNGSVYCTNIPTCTGTFNFTLAPLNYAYLLENYTINQSDPRPFDPATISSPSSNVRTISTSLTSTLTNVSVALTTSGSTPSSPLLIHPNGTQEYLSYSYSGGVISFVTYIQPGTTTLYINSVLAPTNNAAQDSVNAFSVAVSLVVIFFAIIMALGAVMLFFIIKKGGSLQTVFDFITENTVGIMIVLLILILAIVILTAVGAR